MATENSFFGKNVADWDDTDVYPDTSIALEAFRGRQIYLDDQGTLANHAVRFDQLAAAVAAVSSDLLPLVVLVSNLATPTELNALTPDFVGQRAFCYPSAPVSGAVGTTYFAVPKGTLTLATPYIMSSGSASYYWVALGGEYIGTDPSIQRQLFIGLAPTASGNVIRLADQEKIIQTLAIGNIDTPTELNAISGRFEGQLLLVYPSGASVASGVIYRYMEVLETEILPYRVDASTAGFMWIAQGGNRVEAETKVQGTITAAGNSSDVIATRDLSAGRSVIADSGQAGSGALYIGGGSTTANAFRLIWSGGSLLLQKFISSVWTTIATFSASAKTQTLTPSGNFAITVANGTTVYVNASAPSTVTSVTDGEFDGQVLRIFNINSTNSANTVTINAISGQLITNTLVLTADDGSPTSSLGSATFVWDSNSSVWRLTSFVNGA